MCDAGIPCKCNDGVERLDVSDAIESEEEARHCNSLMNGAITSTLLLDRKNFFVQPVGQGAPRGLEQVENRRRLAPMSSGRYCLIRDLGPLKAEKGVKHNEAGGGPHSWWPLSLSAKLPADASVGFDRAVALGRVVMAS
jgi:hypothetical protein